MNNFSLAVVILAAGKGTRMNSVVPKVLHRILNQPIIKYVLNSAVALKPQRISVVLGHRSDLVKSELIKYKIDVAIQEQQMGTGHAVLCAKKTLRDFKGNILILSGDVPLIAARTLTEFCDHFYNTNSTISFITSKLDNPSGYGRILRRENNQILDIVEEKDARRDQKKIKEINAGIYLVESSFLWESLNNLNSDNRQNEYYLPGIIRYGIENGVNVSTYELKDHKETLGINTRKQLWELETIMKEKINSKHLENGVTIVDPSNTYISEDVIIGKDTVINPNTHIYGKTQIGENCTIGPSVYIEDSILGNEVVVKFSSYLTNCKIENRVTMGPFCHLRPEAHVKDNAKIGNFVEIKKSQIGIGSKVPHLSYVGDATVGNNVNIGAGTITCNYDGVNKHQTIIEDNVFIGSDTMLVAPIRIGKEATTAAGSTITKDVEQGALAIERSIQKEISGWSERKKKKKDNK